MDDLTLDEGQLPCDGWSGMTISITETEECIRYLQRRHVVIMVRESNKIGNEFWNHLRFQIADWVQVQFFKTK
jgi:hypothetical protein